MSNTAYSSIQHLADALFLNHDPTQKYFVLLSMGKPPYTAYFDASGHPQDTSMLVVGGFIATVKEWNAFSIDWDIVLKKYNVPYFHMNRLEAKRKPFDHEKWRRNDLCKSFLSELIGVISRNNCYGLMTALPINAWTAINREFCMLEYKLTPLAMVGCMAATGAYEWCRERRIPDEHVEFIFEDGDEHKGDFMTWTKIVWGWTPLFKGKSLLPLQACDFIAWEGRKAATDMAALGVTPDDHEYRPSLERLFMRINQGNRIWDENGLRRFCKKHAVKQR